MGGLQFPALDEAIARYEGIYVPGSLAQTNNNPGNIVGSSGTGGFSGYGSLSEGLQAEDALISQYASQGYSLGDLLSKWSQTTSSSGYQQGISSALGAPLDTSVSSLQGLPSDASNALQAQNTGLWNSIQNFLTKPLGNPLNLPQSVDPGSATTPQLPGSNLGGPIPASPPVLPDWRQV